jgi:hypothetical protein
MAHTPGPWLEKGDEIRAFDGTPICQVFAVDADAPMRGRPTADANSRLLAAAPVLLAALRVALPHVEGEDLATVLDAIRGASLTAFLATPSEEWKKQNGLA